jgi:hypothetical protein
MGEAVEMAGVVDIANEDRRQLQDYMRREFTALLREPQATLYHYTDGAAAASILDQSSLRATNILYLDDGREIRHAIDLFREALAIRRDRATDPQSSELNALIARYLEDTGQYVPPDVWIATFTERRDGGDLWDRYSHIGHGVALGFTPQPLGKAAEAGGAFLAPCCYDDATKIAIMGRGLELLERLYAAKTVRRWGQSNEAGARLVRYVVRELALFGALMKRSELAGENEWRLVIVNASQTAVGARRIKAEAKRDYTALYIDLELGDASDRLPIGEILVGPGEYQEMTERAFRTLLYKYGYERADVTLARM